MDFDTITRWLAKLGPPIFVVVAALLMGANVARAFYSYGRWRAMKLNLVEMMEYQQSRADNNIRRAKIREHLARLDDLEARIRARLQKDSANPELIKDLDELLKTREESLSLLADLLVLEERRAEYDKQVAGLKEEVSNFDPASGRGIAWVFSITGLLHIAFRFAEYIGNISPKKQIKSTDHLEGK